MNTIDESIKWIDVKERLPFDGQGVVIMHRKSENFIWQRSITTYRPKLKNTSGNRMYPFGKTCEVKAWYPIPDLPDVREEWIKVKKSNICKGR